MEVSPFMVLVCRSANTAGFAMAVQQPYKSVHSKDKTECGHDKEAFLKNEKSGSAYLCLMYRQKWVWGNFIM
ncbi:hypothetical protein DFO70_105116 [Cytobacillus firmus]|uniref:Uncharacterized protein n=3 Tax=Cytobacillus TaxID=2675230 RepID=A0A366JWI7_CYTFI|nr:hypothetical protein DFO70_105116 [Cytobacillus firmus]TDX47700.1 hypothetical protein DFO72_101815 [Cytobacillus oceanisediminis]